MIIIQKFQANNHLAVIFPLVVASEAWRSIAHTDDTVREWTATSAVSLLAVTENQGLASS
jgi:hypothetical protein